MPPERKELLKKIAGKYPIDPPGNPDWKMTLASGVGVELLGICENPSLGRKWWKPDGKYLNYEPHFGTTRVYLLTSDRTKYDAAFRMHWPEGTMSSRLRVKSLTDKISGGTSSSSSGNHLDKKLLTMSFGGDQPLTSLDVEFKIWTDKGGYESVFLKGIPLVPGDNEAFKIVTDK